MVPVPERLTVLPACPAGDVRCALTGLNRGDKNGCIDRLDTTGTEEMLMDNPIRHYWEIRLKKIKTALESNNFDVYIADNKDLAKKIAYDTIIPAVSPTTISWGGSMTFVGTRLYEALKNDPRYTVIDTYDKSLSLEQSMQRRRESLPAGRRLHPRQPADGKGRGGAGHGHPCPEVGRGRSQHFSQAWRAQVSRHLHRHGRGGAGQQNLVTVADGHDARGAVNGRAKIISRTQFSLACM